MTIEELKQIAEQSWECCDGFTEQDKQIWINGFVIGAIKFADKITFNTKEKIKTTAQDTDEFPYINDWDETL